MTAILHRPEPSPPPAWSATDVAAAARALEAAGRPVLRLEVGEPDFPTPPHVVLAATAALANGATRYAPGAGMAELREAVAGELAGRGVPTTPSSVVVAPGARLLVHCAALMLLRPGDEALVPDPGYAAYASAARRAAATPIPYPVEGDGTLDVAALADRIGPRTRVLFLNAPHNPTGGTLAWPELAALAAIVERHDLTVVADEIYSHLVDDGEHASLAAVPGMAARTVLIDGFSKRFAMTGWRLAYAALPPQLVSRMARLLAETASCTPPFVQLAGVAALAGPRDAAIAHARVVRERRDMLAMMLRSVPGVRATLPHGGLYLFPCVRELIAHMGVDDVGLARTLLLQQAIACVPGSAFGGRGAGHLRVALTAPAERLADVAAALRSLASVHGVTDRAVAP